MKRGIAIVIMILALIGVGISVYLFSIHGSDMTGKACEINSTFSCGTVDQSEYSEIYGIPVSLLGIIGYGLLALAALVKIFDKVGDRGIDWFLLLASLGGMGFALYLTAIEAFVLDAWCLYCVAQQIDIAIILVLVVVLFWKERRVESRE
ncbi:MAG: vitamin K epoxide reductase family protein [Candidatus Uhrbacteria bacterium]